MISQFYGSRIEVKLEELPPINHKTKDIIDETIKSRRSVRAFLPTEVPIELIVEILNLAAHAPSGVNMQPWRVHVITGPKKQALSEEIIRAFLDPEAIKKHSEDYPYYPSEWTDPYLSRRRKFGSDFYSILGIKRDDNEEMKAQDVRNYQFFGAPVGIFFTLDRKLQQGSLFDYGMFVQNVMLAAKARGLDTCPQVAFNKFHKIVSKHLNFSQNEQLVCGMSLGYADDTQRINQLVTDRESAKNFTHFHLCTSKL